MRELILIGLNVLVLTVLAWVILFWIGGVL
jgi:hypothetical protein